MSDYLTGMDPFTGRARPNPDSPEFMRATISRLRAKIAALERVVKAADKMREDYYRHDGTDIHGQPVQSIREYDAARKEG